ncbi:DUF502 domain-containing protein [Endozoicomonas sp. Mp262]|uniref:DUF502 domain-containing protein n=1 Tax=Endozoicomonas sp. Mp262 TaxID=2919499 RepID=UPI0021D88701
MNIIEKVKLKVLSSFLGESILGGVTVILPLIIIAFFFSWLLKITGHLLEPLAHLFDSFGLPMVLSDIVVALLLISVCAGVGHLVRTRLGEWLYKKLETDFFVRIPGYTSLKELIEILIGKESSPFKGEVAKVWLYGRSVPTWTVALITSKHPDGTYTAFVPTSPSPASGVIYHLGADQVEIHPEISIDQAFKIIVSCGAGSAAIFEKLSDPAPEQNGNV